MNQELKDLREKINAIDDQLLTLITERSALLDSVLAAKIHTAAGKAPSVFIPEREQKIIDRLTIKNKSNLSDKAIANIFQSIINACRNFQIANNKLENEILSISIQGIEGSYSEQAALKFCRQKSLLNYHIDYAVSSDNVLKNIISGKTKYGIVALNNAQGGLVVETIDALSKHQYRIIDSVILLVEHSLMTLPGTQKEQVKNIVSHPQALKQCHEYLQKEYPHSKQIPWIDTALSARDLVAGKLPADSTVIAHANCIEKYGLVALDKNIQDLNDNETLFLVIRAAPENE